MEGGAPSSVLARPIIGLGSNLGDRVASLRAALASLQPFLTDVKISAVYESDALLPHGAPLDWDQPFLNIAVTGTTSLSPDELLAELKKVERALGRQGRERWAPREIDLDILAWGGEVVRRDGLQIPHPGLLDRPFALLPLADLFPDWIVPAAIGAVAGLAPTATASVLATRWRARSQSDAELLGVPFRTYRIADELESFARVGGPNGPRLVGVLNLTPDSFSDGGKFLAIDAALAQLEALVAAGADVIDLGAESTRPGATSVSAAEEWKRLGPFLDALKPWRASAAGRRVKISIDTRHPETARKVLAWGVDWINDVSGLESAAMRKVVAEEGCEAVFMHNLGVPAAKDRVLPEGVDPVTEVLAWAGTRLAELEASGIARDRLIFDPGVGFGKNAEQSRRLLAGVAAFRELGVRIMIGHSRKSFLGGQRPFADRDIETLAVSLALARQGVEFLRIHDVAMHRRALDTAQWLEGAGK